MLEGFGMQGSSAVLHQGRKLISCKDKRQTILMDNFSIEAAKSKTKSEQVRDQYKAQPT